MLVLKRKRNQKLIIAIPPSHETQTGLLEILNIKGQEVTLGITATEGIQIDRLHTREQKYQDLEYLLSLLPNSKYVDLDNVLSSIRANVVNEDKNLRTSFE